MSDKGRKSFSKKMEEDTTPQEQKSMGERAKESVTNAYDKMASKMEPESDKSMSQKMHDETKYNKH